MSSNNLLSAQLKIDEEAEHYCRVHSPKRRRKVVQDKVKTGMEKLNTLKMIEKDVEDGVVKERSNVRLARLKLNKLDKESFYKLVWAVFGNVVKYEA